MLSEYRLILYHKQPSSGRTLFLRVNETVCQFGGIPPTSQLVKGDVGGNQVDKDLSDLLADAEKRLGMPNGTLKINPEFSAAIAHSTTLLPIYLARFATTDAPQEHLAEQDGKFIALTEARRLPPIELELLRLAYSAIMDEY